MHVRHCIKPGLQLPKAYRAQRGSALLLVLLCIALLSFAVVQHIALVNQELEETSFRSGQFRCQQLAESGISIAMLPSVSNGDPALDQTLYPGETIHVELRSESARLNINTLLKSDKAEVLQRLFRLWGVREDEAKQATEALYEWTHPADAPLIPPPPTSDAPTSDAPQRMMTRPFATVGDLAMLPEMEPVRRANPAWANAFTIWGSGQLDLNEATPDLIAALCEIPYARATQFVEKRNGSDHLPFTADDTQYTQIDAALADLSLPPASPDTPSPLHANLTVTPSFRRIVSTGTANGRQRIVEAVTHVGATSAVIYEWAER